MWLTISQRFLRWHPENYGNAVSRSGAGRRRGLSKFAVANLTLVLSAIILMPAKAQQVSQAGFDPRQTERRFNVPQSGQPPSVFIN